MGEDDGGGGDGERVPGGLLGGVGQVHHDPQPVHLLHHRLQKWGDLKYVVYLGYYIFWVILVILVAVLVVFLNN